MKSRITHLKLTLRTSKHNSGIVTHHLRGNHCECLTLSRVDLARHDARPGFILRQTKFTQPASRTRAEVPDIIGNFVQADCDSGERAVCFNKGIVRREGLELNNHEQVCTRTKDPNEK